MAVTLYWVVYADGGGTPTGAQIAAGQNSTGSAALAPGSEPYTSAGTYDEATAITSLSPNPAYQVAWVAFDGSSYSSVVESSSITTLAARQATLSQTLGSLTLSSTGQVALQATLSQTLGALTLSATGQLPIAGALAATLGTLPASGAGAVDLAGQSTVTLGERALAATGAVGLQAAATQTDRK